MPSRRAECYTFTCWEQMEDEDDYDLDDELEQALAEDGHDEEGQQGEVSL